MKCCLHKVFFFPPWLACAIHYNEQHQVLAKKKHFFLEEYICWDDQSSGHLISWYRRNLWEFRSHQGSTGDSICLRSQSGQGICFSRWSLCYPRLFSSFGMPEENYLTHFCNELNHSMVLVTPEYVDQAPPRNLP